jgi:hypothetical protein
MAAYWGKAAIKTRMGWKSDAALYRAIKKLGFPCYRRHDPQAPIRVRLYTNDQLIVAWELTLAQDYRENLIAGANHRA